MGQTNGDHTPIMIFWRLCCVFFLLSLSARAQSGTAGISQMTRLGKMMVGDWKTVEVVQHGKPVPKNAGREGIVRVRLAGGGTVLVSEGHSQGSVGGDLRWLITTWWDASANCYRLLVCFATPGSAGCELRGTARWEDEKFVNTYEEMINGKRTKVQDIWSDIRPNSHTLTAARDIGNGIMVPYVVSHETRR
jgi:hypothetical protein